MMWSDGEGGGYDYLIHVHVLEVHLCMHLMAPNLVKYTLLKGMSYVMSLFITAQVSSTHFHL